MTTIDLLLSEPPTGSERKKPLATLPPETDVDIDDIELDPASHPLEAKRRSILVQACVAALDDGEFAPTVDLTTCIPRDSSSPIYACLADVAWIVAQAQLGAKKIRARIWPEDASDRLELRLWRERAEPMRWRTWDQAVYIRSLLESRGETDTDADGETPSKKALAKTLRKPASTITELAQLATVSQHLLQLVELEKLRVDDGTRVKGALLASELGVVQRAISLAALQSRGGEFGIEAAIAILTGRLHKQSTQKPMLVPLNDGPVERAGRALACIADALAEDVARAIRSANPSQDVTEPPTGSLRAAGPEHAVIRFSAAPTPRQWGLLEELLRAEGLLS